MPDRCDIRFDLVAVCEPQSNHSLGSVIGDDVPVLFRGVPLSRRMVIDRFVSANFVQVRDCCAPRGIPQFIRFRKDFC